MKKLEDYIKEERDVSELEYEFVKQFVTLRKQLHLTQQEMANNADVIRETVARIENFITSPQIRTMIRLLEPIGYTIKIVPISEVKDKSQ